MSRLPSFYPADVQHARALVRQRRAKRAAAEELYGALQFALAVIEQPIFRHLRADNAVIDGDLSAIERTARDALALANAADPVPNLDPVHTAAIESHVKELLQKRLTRPEEELPW